MTAIELSTKMVEILDSSQEMTRKEKSGKKDKKERKKKEKKRKRKASDSEEKSNLEIDENIETLKDSSSDIASSKQPDDKRTAKREERKALMEKVPEKDEHGVAYSKLQRRRMMKRVKRGLPPVPTPEEEAERIRNEAQMKREEEDELAGILHTSSTDKKNEDEDGDLKERAEEIDGKDEREIDAVQETNLEVATPEETNKLSDGKDKKKQRKSKPVPTDYVCQACKNKCQPAHWIYDCPNKITMKGVNQVSKRFKGLHDPDEKKIFVSGLPFDANRKFVEGLFVTCGKMIHCKLLTFSDTGRCKGQAYVTFDSLESAKKALALNGTTIENDAGDKEKKKETSGSKRKELRLKVSKVL
eukprot:CAMPEP_0194207298 /NCGR_PEP_ID=MMETSP0156-20130528/6076_1 /TAXON_ID=33649 /ORGANISM="Thalassionema nitzschioides, Strain L26-B" /LENGTH=357 /DNA_ID=CAMNT_0038934021 /DNA_START=104 /DNA_END=1174 /DNA_ORIENTATION=-